MDFNTSQSSLNSPVYQEDYQRNPNFDYDSKLNQFTFQQIEIYLQSQYGINIPAIVFEYSGSIGKDFVGWDYEDLYEFFCHFGEILTLEINGKVSYILFKTFFDANTAREFLQNGSNFKDNEKSNFCVRWFNFEDMNSISEEFKNKINGLFPQNQRGGTGNFMMSGNQGYNMGMNMNMMSNGQQMKMNSMMGVNPGMTYQNGNGNNMSNSMNNMGQMNNMNNMNNNQYPYYMMKNGNGSVGNMQNMQNNGMNNHNNSNGSQKQTNQMNVQRKSSNTSLFDDQDSGFNVSVGGGKKNGNLGQNGKYTCRFEIQIENDKEFQVARRLIGAKGCNMKKIVEMCSKKQDGSTVQDAVKLRLRGKGSGYKEGPLNKESDELLHLCISSKFLDRYKTAIQLVNELILTVHEEYKKYCERTNKTPVPYLAIKKEEGISSRKNTKSEYDF